MVKVTGSHRSGFYKGAQPQSSSSTPGLTSHTPSSFMTELVGGHGLVREKCERLSVQIFEIDRKIAGLESAIARRTGELVRDSYYLDLKNERDRKAFIDEYLNYDDFIENRLLLEGEKAHLLREYAIQFSLLTALSNVSFNKNGNR